jgi:Domain of unknown function (DUF4956)
MSRHVLSRLTSNIILRTAVYYVVLFGLSAWLWQLPQAQSVIHASLEALLSGGTSFMGIGSSAAAKYATPVHIDTPTLALMMGASMIGAVLLSIPVAWIYTLTRQKKDYQQSVVHALILLPALVAGVVVLVKYSLALAFSLAGILAAVRFRTTLEDTKDAVYVFLAAAIGLAAAVQLPMAAVISVIFNLVVLFLWYTDFGKAATYEGNKAQKQLEATQARMRQTGSFVAMLDDDIFANMTPDQLDLAADRAWRRKRRLMKDELPDDEMQKREVLLRLHTSDPDTSRAAVEPLFDEFLKKWRLGGVVHEPDGTHVIEYAIQLKKSARSEDLLNAIHGHAHNVEAEIT